jgi:hypothetical protein
VYLIEQAQFLEVVHEDSACSHWSDRMTRRGSDADREEIYPDSINVM